MTSWQGLHRFVTHRSFDSTQAYVFGDNQCMYTLGLGPDTKTGIIAKCRNPLRRWEDLILEIAIAGETYTFFREGIACFSVFSIGAEPK